MAFITVNNIRTTDYSGYLYTETVSFSEDYSDPRFSGAAFYAGDGQEKSKLREIAYEGKTAYVFVDKRSVETESFLECFLSARHSVVFCSEDRETLEKLYKKDRLFDYLLIVKSPVGAEIGSLTGYNCALPYKKSDLKRAESLHERNHRFAVYGVKTDEELAACEKMKADVVFLDPSFK